MTITQNQPIEEIKTQPTVMPKSSPVSINGSLPLIVLLVIAFNSGGMFFKVSVIEDLLKTTVSNQAAFNKSIADRLDLVEKDVHRIKLLGGFETQVNPPTK